MKQKFSLIFAIILITLSLSAAAAFPFHELALEIARVQKEVGDFPKWTTEQKIHLARGLSDLGYLKDQRLSALPEDEAQADQAVTEILTDYMGMPAEEICFPIIMEKILGPFDDWTYEQKAWHSALTKEVGTHRPGLTFYMTPQGKISEEQALKIARDGYARAYKVDEKELDNYQIETSFQIPEFAKEGEEQPYWLITFYEPKMPEKDSFFYRIFFCVHPDTGQLFYSELLIPYGESPFLDAREAPASEQWAGLEKVLTTGQHLLTEVIGLSVEEVDALDAEARFIYSDFFENGKYPFWLIEYRQGGEVRYRATVDVEGDFLEITRAGEIFLQRSNNVKFSLDAQIRALGGFGDEEHPIFYDWSLEKKAAFNQKWKPFVDAYIDAHPTFRREGSIAYEATRFRYGLPTEAHIPQDEAIRIAKEEIVKLGANPDTIDKRKVYSYFDITQPDKALWKFTFLRAQGAQQEDWDHYRVVLDAQTGNVEKAFIVKDQDRLETYY